MRSFLSQRSLILPEGRECVTNRTCPGKKHEIPVMTQTTPRELVQLFLAVCARTLVDGLRERDDGEGCGSTAT